MKLLPNLVILSGLVGLLSAPLEAQWPDYPTRNVPRLPDGEPDLEGPAPRTPWGDPDLSGIWERSGGGGDDADSEDPEPEPGTPPSPTFFDAGANFDEGLPYTDWARELRDQRMADNMKDNPDAHCLPIGLLQYHMHPQPRRIVQTEDLIVILYESNYGVREIFLDGRPEPDNDPQPWWYGYSSGHWEGATLVIETTHFRDGGWLDVNGSPLTSEAKVTERITRTDYGHLTIDFTVEDPQAYTEPWTVRMEHRIMLDTALIEFICLENERSSEFFDD
jgi:hypothetical protein